jgi:hypothetical protein
MLLSAARTKVKSEGGFDSSASNTSDSAIDGWINERVQEALATSKWRKVELELGVTVAGQAQYAVPASVVDIRAIRVDSGRRWLSVSTEDLFDLKSGDASLRNAAGAFAANFEADADPVVELWPVPTESGLSIAALAAVTLTTDLVAADPIPLPDDLVNRLAVEGARRRGI